MKTLGPIYVQKVNYSVKSFLPLVELGWTNETEEPYRIGKCLVFRVPFTKPGFVLGLWVDRLKDVTGEDDALIRALEGRILNINSDEIENW